MAEVRHVMRGPSGLVYQTFDDAIESYMRHNYPDFDQPKQSYFVPPFVQPNYKGPLGNASGALKRLSDGVQAQWKGWTNEDKVLQSIKAFSDLYPQPMFVFTSLKFQNLSQWLKKDLQLKESASLFPHVRREIDVLLIHRVLGLIVIEIKSRKYHEQLKVKGKFVRDPCQQLIKIKANLEKSAYLSFFKPNSELSLQITLVHAYPAEDLSEENVNCEHCGAYQLDKKYFEDTAMLHDWFEQIELEQVNHSQINQLAYKKMIPRLIAGQSAVAAYAEMTQLILEQTNLADTYKLSKEQNCKRQQKPGLDADLSQVARSESTNGIEILAKEWKFLNPEQLRVWFGPRWQVFAGPYGTGKTILLRYKALNELISGHNVLVISSFPLSEEYKTFFQTNEKEYLSEHVPFGRWSVIQFKTRDQPEDYTERKIRTFANAIVTSLSASSSNILDVFIDEAQCSNMKTIDQVVRALKPSMYWIAVISDEAKAVRQLIAKNNHENTRNTHAQQDLLTCMRCTRQIFQFWSKEKEERREMIQLLQHGEQDVFDKIELGHQVQGPTVQTIRCYSLCEATQHAVNEIKDLIMPKVRMNYGNKRFNHVQERKYDPKEILVTYDISTFDPKPRLNRAVASSMLEFRRLLAAEHIGTCSLVSHASNELQAVALASELLGDELSSFEWHVVIIVCQQSKDFYFSVLPSRCIFHLICIKYKKLLSVQLSLRIKRWRRKSKAKKKIKRRPSKKEDKFRSPLSRRA